jgi:hypothetical protein
MNRLGWIVCGSVLAFLLIVGYVVRGIAEAYEDSPISEIPAFIGLFHYFPRVPFNPWRREHDIIVEPERHWWNGPRWHGPVITDPRHDPNYYPHHGPNNVHPIQPVVHPNHVPHVEPHPGPHRRGEEGDEFNRQETDGANTNLKPNHAKLVDGTEQEKTE